MRDDDLNDIIIDDENEEQIRKGGSKKLFLVVAMAVILLAVIVFAIYALTRSENTTTETSPTPPPPPVTNPNKNPDNSGLFSPTGITPNPNSIDDSIDRIKKDLGVKNPPTTSTLPPIQGGNNTIPTTSPTQNPNTTTTITPPGGGGIAGATQPQQGTDLDSLYQPIPQTIKPTEVIPPKNTTEPKPAEKPKPAEPKQPATPPKIVNIKSDPNGIFYIQAASVAKFSDDSTFAKKLKSYKLPYKVQEESVNDKTVYRVLIGPYGSKADATKVLESVKYHLEKEAFIKQIKN
ncbi:hypothetical protein CCZ01_08255 [Helicobacter monodelphidis]|uniref:SPOR domain-containing protein n=1 Tax=Helicobacter sp. 15-1451 TaxID=2004995 RepID=UPI000DCD35C3|nr:SPOR domain-containing protein [Helicobacter sp. 15-1451]RAX56840.1 hypothetical protein CCZ01_08255 [Helicobacter sp. 15-1451]